MAWVSMAIPRRKHVKSSRLHVTFIHADFEDWYDDPVSPQPHHATRTLLQAPCSHYSPDWNLLGRSHSHLAVPHSTSCDHHSGVEDRVWCGLSSNSQQPFLLQSRPSSSESLPRHFHPKLPSWELSCWTKEGWWRSMASRGMLASSNVLFNDSFEGLKLHTRSNSPHLLLKQISSCVTCWYDASVKFICLESLGVSVTTCNVWRAGKCQRWTFLLGCCSRCEE